jgi:hypothetical protein
MAGLLADKDVKNDALLGVLALDAQILEIARVPERVEVALDGNRIVSIAGMGEHPGQDGFLGDAPVADDPDLVNRVRCLGRGLGHGREGSGHQSQNHSKARHAPATRRRRERWKRA